MDNFDVYGALKAGYTMEEIDAFLKESAIPQPEKQAYQPPVTAHENAVSPFNRDVEFTQGFDNYNPGMGYYNDLHKGNDFATAEGEQGKFPIGGQVLEKGYDPAYGYNAIVGGYSPEEFKQLGPEDLNNALSNYGNDAVRISHLQELPPQEVGQYVATGEAGLKFGSSGNSTGPHTDIESFPQGAPNDFEQKRSFINNYKLMKLLGR